MAKDPMSPQTSRKSSRRKSATIKAETQRNRKTYFCTLPEGEGTEEESGEGTEEPKVVMIMSVMVMTMRGQVA